MSSSFLTTRWSLVLRAGGAPSPEASEALEELALRYWFPLYAYARRRGLDDEGARDLVQGFFARLLERRDLEGVSPERGRFRAYLLAGVKHFLVNERERAGTLKRGGDREHLSIDTRDADTRFGLEPTDDATPERHFERAWAHAVLERAMDRLAADYAERGKSALFERLRGLLTEGDDTPYAELAAEHGMTEGAVKVAVHRLRQRFGEKLRAEVADTVPDPADVEDELRQLFGALSGG